MRGLSSPLKFHLESATCQKIRCDVGAPVFTSAPLLSQAPGTARPSEAAVADSFVYCLREQGGIAFKTKQRESCPLWPRVAGLAENSPRLRSPYGLAFDETGKTLWVADKHAHTIWRFAFNGSSLESHGAIRLQKANGPCMLDYQPECGLLIGCYGVSSERGAVLRLKGDAAVPLTPMDFCGRVTHCCWLPDGGYCYVTRDDSVLWRQEAEDAPAVPLTLPGNARILSPENGRLEKLRLRYVQGMYFSKKRNALMVADASLGAIFALHLDQGEFRLVAGKPTLSDSTYKADVQAGDPSVWLGPIRALSEDREGCLVWLDGESGQLMRLSNGGIEILGPAVPGRERSRLLGCGMIRIPPRHL